jgi:hypothetical protein
MLQSLIRVYPFSLGSADNNSLEFIGLGVPIDHPLTSLWDRSLYDIFYLRRFIPRIV